MLIQLTLMFRRHELTEPQWLQMEPLLPRNGQRGGQWNDHRCIRNGIWWVLATGAPWRDLPERFGPWQTVYDRFRPWVRTGLGDQILHGLQVQRQANGHSDWNRFLIAGRSVRAHKAAAGARQTTSHRANPLTTRSGGARVVSVPSCT